MWQNVKPVIWGTVKALRLIMKRIKELMTVVLKWFKGCHLSILDSLAPEGRAKSTSASCIEPGSGVNEKNNVPASRAAKQLNHLLR